jgi:hypothetical protein
MFGKFFASTFTGSMMGAGPNVIAVWAYAIAHAVKGQVELNPRFLAAVIGTDESSIAAAIEHLCAPDPRSRSKEHEGRRLIREGEFQYFMPTHEKYRDIRNEDERRAYNRLKQREHRAKQRVKASVNDSQRQSRVSANTEAETESETERGDHNYSPPLSSAKTLSQGDTASVVSGNTSEPAVPVPAPLSQSQIISLEKLLKDVDGQIKKLRDANPYGFSDENKAKLKSMKKFRSDVRAKLGFFDGSDRPQAACNPG